MPLLEPTSGTIPPGYSRPSTLGIARKLRHCASPYLFERAIRIWMRCLRRSTRILGGSRGERRDGVERRDAIDRLEQGLHSEWLVETRAHICALAQAPCVAA